MAETLSSGLTLTIPTRGETNWDATIKTSCFQKISEHDHTGGGKGIQIATNAIAADAVTGVKIRLANNQALRARNAANSADVNLISLNASDNLDISIPGNVNIQSSGAGNAVIITTSATGIVGFNNVVTRRWTLDANGHFIPGATNSYDLGITGQEIRGIVARNIGTYAAVDLRFFTGGTNQWKINSSTGAWQPETDNGLNIGATGAAVSRTHTNRIQISADTAPASPAAGSWVIYADAGDSNRLKAKASTGTVVILGTP